MQMSASNTPLRIGLIGAGAMGANHLRVLRDFDSGVVSVVGLAESMPDTLSRAVRIFHVPGFADYREMIEQTMPDLVLVVTPTATHFEVASFALEHGCNTLVEKPIAKTVEEASALVALAHARGLILAVGHVERFNPAVRRLKQLLEEGMLGDIYQLHGRRLGPFPPRIRDVGVTLDLATHDIDVMRFVTGSHVESVFARTRQLVRHNFEDLLLAVLSFDSGALGMLDVNRLTPTKARELTVTGEKGLFYLNYLTQELTFTENDFEPSAWGQMGSLAGVGDGVMTRFKVHKAEPLRLEYEDIFQAIRGGSQASVTGIDGLAALSVAQELLESAKTGKVLACGAPIRAL
ncbi:MAG TPA: Gfo/Idh/MocA family oxidoreductase [Ktedonobacterales bacterium]